MSDNMTTPDLRQINARINVAKVIEQQKESGNNSGYLEYRQSLKRIKALTRLLDKFAGRWSCDIDLRNGDIFFHARTKWVQCSSTCQETVLRRLLHLTLNINKIKIECLECGLSFDTGTNCPYCDTFGRSQS